MDQEKKKTVGEISLELQQKTPDSFDPIEIASTVCDSEKYITGLTDCVKDGKTLFEGDFFIVVITRTDKILKRVSRLQFRARKTCPSPQYDESVYKYGHEKESIEFLWTVPDKGACNLLRDNALVVVDEERDLLNFVLDFYDGTLLNKAKKFNGEVTNSNIILTR